MLSNLKGYFRPKSIPEALALLEKNSGSILVIAGGSKLVLTDNPVVQELVDISGLNLDFIKEENGTTRIGATTRIQQIVDSPILDQRTNGLLPVAAALTHKSRQVRNAATLGGELLTTTALSPLYCAFLVLQAQVRLAGNEEFALAMNIFLNRKGLAGGLLLETVIPDFQPVTYTGFAYINSSSHLPVLCAAVRVSIRKGCFEHAKIAITGTARVPQRMHDVEEYLAGRECSESNIIKGAEEACKSYEPISDRLAGIDFRKEASRMVIKRALRECINKWEDSF
jgi:probable selenate reductase FAD-binding subunit